ncbi:MAG: extracellular solute-binding protein [Phycisphaerales bacterium]|nr:extracellular solute-binding protein [Phycisphaerales bacterium]
MALGAVAVPSVLGGCASRRSRGRGNSIELWTLALKGRRELEEYVEGQIAAFKRVRPGVDVAWVDVPFRELDRKLMSAAAAGRAPDVVNFSDKTYARFVGLGALRDLTPILPKGSDAASVYLPGALGLCRMRGQLLALPWYLTTQTALVNEELLKRAGMTAATLPKTWAGMREAARGYRKHVGDDGTYLFSVPLGHESDFLQMLFADGLMPMKADAGARGGRLRANLMDADVVKVVKEWVELFREGAMPREAATQGVQHLTDLYKRGRVAVINFGPNFLNVIRQESPRVYEATVLGPTITGALGRAHIAVMVMGVSAQSKEPALAAELAWMLTGDESQRALCSIVPVLPSTRATLESGMFRAPEASAVMTPAARKLAEAQAIAADSLKNAVAFTPALAEWPDLRRAFEDRIKRAMLGGEPVEDALRVIDAEWVRILDAAADAPGDALPVVGAVKTRGTQAGRLCHQRQEA